MEEQFVFLKNHKGHWFHLPEYLEEEFNQLLENYIMSGKSDKFLEIFKEFRISCSPTEYRKNNLNK